MKLLVMTISDIYVLVYPKILLCTEDIIGCRLSKVTKTDKHVSINYKYGKFKK